MQNVISMKEYVRGEPLMSKEPLSQDAFELIIRMLTHDLEKLIVITSRVMTRLLDGSLTLDNPRHRAIVASSSHAMTRSRRMIIDLNQAMENRTLPVSMESCDLNQLMLEIGHHFSPMAENENIHFTYEGNGKNSIVKADPELMTRIVENFLYNALSHTRSGGWILMQLETGESGAFAVSVANSGDGIPEADLERIFSLGVQLDLKKRGYWRGSGLGLTFCRMAADAMGAQVGAENLDENRGIAFYCRN